MQSLALLCYAFAAGLAFSGIVGTAAEIVTGRRLGFRPPFVAQSRLGRSVALTFAAGPFMIANEALAARRAGLIDGGMLAVWAVAAAVWSTAAGVVVVELAVAASTFL